MKVSSSAPVGVRVAMARGMHGVGRRGVAESRVVSPPLRSDSYDAPCFLP